MTKSEPTQPAPARMFDSHMHTPLCRHAIGEPEEYATQAAAPSIDTTASSLPTDALCLGAGRSGSRPAARERLAASTRSALAPAAHDGAALRARLPSARQPSVRGIPVLFGSVQLGAWSICAGQALSWRNAGGQFIGR